MKSFIRIVLLSLVPVFVFITCENPIGLGSKVNTEKPVIRNAGDENKPGDFIQGDGNRIWLEVEQKFGIAEVYMEVEYVNKITGEVERKRIPAYYDDEQKKWYVDLDTSDMEDGTIKAWITAVDVSGNVTTTTDIVYFVKNTPPQIKLSMPGVDGANFDDDAFLNSLKDTDPLYIGFDLMGLAEDNYGIAEGYPKIMIWPASGIAVDADGLPLQSDGRYGAWRPLVLPNPRPGLTATKFSWPMQNLVGDAAAPGGWRLPNKGEPASSLAPGEYRIRIVTKDLFGNENYYPNRTDNTRGPGGQALNPDDIQKKYIEINYIAADMPIIQYTTYPQYYNTVGNFEVHFTVSSSNPMDNVTAHIININNEDDDIDKYTPAAAKLVGGPYTNLNSLPSSSIELLSSSGVIYYYKLTVTSADAKLWTNLKSSGLTFVRLVATDNQGKPGPVTYQQFFYDVTPPDVVFDRPSNLTNKFVSNTLMEGGAYEILYPASDRPKWVTGSITIGGTAKDNFSLKEIYYHIGKLGDDSNTPSGRESIYNNPANWTNTDLHLESPVSPWSGSPYSFSYTVSFPMDYKTTGGTGLIQELSDIPGYTPTQSTYATTASRERFYLPFYVKVVDQAGNFRVVHYKLSVDPKMDEPNVYITQPDSSAGIPVIGGTVRVAGYAEDNFWMHTVLIRVNKGTSGSPVWYRPPDTPLFYPNALYPNPKPNGTLDDTAGWFKAEKIGDSNNVNWYANINQDRALDPLTSGTTAPVIIQVVAIDAKDDGDPEHRNTNLAGPVETLNVAFSKDVPTISNVKITKTGVADRPWTENIRASGNFSISMDIEAMVNINTLSVRVTTKGTPKALTLVAGKNPMGITTVDSVWTLSAVTNPSVGKAKRTLTVAVNSANTTIPNLTVQGYPYGTTGNFTLEVSVEDDSSNKLTTNNTFPIEIDNLYPTATITTPHVAAENPYQSKFYFVEGNAKDTSTAIDAGNVSGLERVLVYFEKGQIATPGGNITGRGDAFYVKPNGTDASLSDFETYPLVLNHGTSTTAVTTPNVTNYNRFPKLVLNGSGVYTAVNAMVIDYNEGGAPTGDGDGDGTLGETWNGPSANKDFGARVNFSGWTDGPYIVHYLVMDQAGNATHYQNDIYVQNNKPRITSINFGTDINGIDGVTDGTSGTLNEYLYPVPVNLTISEPSTSSAAGLLIPSFRIRGNIFRVRLNIEKGNNAKSAVIYYAGDALSTSNISAANMVRGRVYTIVSQGSAMTDYTKYGAPNNIPNTTFVASGPATGTNGTVTQYTIINRTPAPISGLSVDVPFTNFTSVPDSTKTTLGEITSSNDRFFIIKVFDQTTTAGGPDTEFDQLADVILVKLNIDNVDSKSPSIEVLPFGSEFYVNPSATPPANNPAYHGSKLTRFIPDSEYAKNIYMDGDVKAGYVQYARDDQSTAIDANKRANISGKVKFLGRAEDDQRIGSIWVTITNYNGGNGSGSAFQIAHASAGYLIADAPSGAYAGQWAFTLLGDNTPKDYLTLEYGHTLNWEFMWDSSKVELTARNGVVVTFEIRDAPYSASTPTLHRGTSQTTVNVVPYISEVKTSLSGIQVPASVFNRSALGGYPVQEGEEISIMGFNLGIADVKIDTFALTGVSAITGGIKGTIPDTANSGPLVVTVNSIESFNNNNTAKKKTAHYNLEPNGVNNDKLDNSRYMYVWNAGYLLASAGPSANMTDFSAISNPFFRMDINANRYISYGYYPQQSQGKLRVLKNNTDYDLGTAFSNRMLNTTVAVGIGYNNAGAALSASFTNPSFYAAGSDLSSSDTGNRGFQFGMSNPAGNNNVAGVGLANNNGSIRLINMASSNNDRIKIPRIAVQPTGATRDNYNSDRILISYYDSKADEVRVIYGNVGTTVVQSTTATTNLNYTNPDGNIRYVVPNAASANNVVHSDSSIKLSTTYGGSEYTAVGFLSNGLPLVAWYDSSTSSLIFSYGYKNTAAAPFSTPLTADYDQTSSRVHTNSTGNAWLINAVAIETGKGTHVDMAVDGDNYVHLAYYSNDGGLWYTLIPPTPAATPSNNLRPNISSRTTVKVDTYLAAGTKLMINVRKETKNYTGGGSGAVWVPYISYAHPSVQGTKGSIRVAWRTNYTSTNVHIPPAGSSAIDRFEGTWEVMTVPVSKTVIPKIEEFVCNGVPTTATWPSGAAPGGTTNLTYSSNLNQTIVVSYMTDRWYEGAILKGNITTVPPILQK
jgi:hypothetical protein